MDKEGEGRSRAASQSAVGERGPIRMGERLGGLFKTGEGGTKVPGPFKAVVRLVVYPSARTHRSFRRNAVLSRLRWPEELLGDHGGFRSPEPFGVPLGCAAARGLFYLRAALRRPGLAGSAPRGAICGPAEQKHGGGAAPPPFWCGAGAAAAAAAAPRGRGWWRCRGQRRDSLRGGERGRPPAGARAALPGCGARGGAHPRPCGDGNRAPSPCRRGAPGARGSRPRRCGIAPRRGAGARFPLSAPPGAAAAARPARRWAARRCGCSGSWTSTWSWRAASSPARGGSASSSARPRWGAGGAGVCRAGGAVFGGRASRSLTGREGVSWGWSHLSEGWEPVCATAVRIVIWWAQCAQRCGCAGYCARDHGTWRYPRTSGLFWRLKCLKCNSTVKRKQ